MDTKYSYNVVTLTEDVLKFLLQKVTNEDIIKFSRISKQKDLNFLSRRILYSDDPNYLFITPIVIDKYSGSVIDGARRLLALEKLEFSKLKPINLYIFRIDPLIYRMFNSELHKILHRPLNIGDYIDTMEKVRQLNVNKKFNT